MNATPKMESASNLDDNSRHAGLRSGYYWRWISSHSKTGSRIQPNSPRLIKKIINPRRAKLHPKLGKK